MEIPRPRWLGGHVDMRGHAQGREGEAVIRKRIEEPGVSQERREALCGGVHVAAEDPLKQQWRELFDCEPPPFNRRYLESRLAYRIQELTYGGLKRETVKRLEALGEQLDGGDRKKSGMRADRDRPIAGTRLLREWQGVEQIVTVTADGFEWQGRPYRSLSAIARAITGTRWNGWVFFGLKNHRRSA